MLETETTTFWGVLRLQAQRSIWFTLLFTLLLVFGMMMILVPLLMAGVATANGISIPELTSVLSQSEVFSPSERAIFRTIQGLQQIIVWCIPAVAMAWILGQPAQRLSLQWPQKRGGLPILLAVVTILVSTPVVGAMLIPAEQLQLPSFLSGIEEWIIAQESMVNRQLTFILANGDPGDLWPNILVFAIMPGLFEELFFRGFLQGKIERHWGAHVAVWLSAFIFSAIHFQFLGFFSRLTLGVLLGYFVCWSGSLIPAIFAHFAFNLSSVLAAHFGWEALEEGGQMPLESFSLETILFSAAATLLLLLVYFRLFAGAPAPKSYAE